MCFYVAFIDFSLKSKLHLNETRKFMQGKILEYDIQKSSGLISGNDGKRYSFHNAEWKSKNIYPAQNMSVDFTQNDDNATQIYAINRSYESIQSPNARENSSLAIISFVFGVVGFLSSWWLFSIPSLVAIITGHIARSKIARSEGALDGDGLALAGLILGYVVLAIYLLIVLVIGAGIMVALANN